MFNIFKRKEKLISKSQSKSRTILCIPGNWNDLTDIVIKIAESNLNEFIFAGRILLNLKTNQAFELEVCERDDRMKDSFKRAGMVNKFSEQFLNEVDNHKYVVYLSAETGNTESAKSIIEAGKAILKSGGIGVKVETTGKAFTKEHWIELLDHYDESEFNKMFVLPV